MRLIIILALSLAAAFAGPAAAADKLVPDNAAGALEAHRGKPWRTPLFICAGYHTYNAGRLRDSGDTPGAFAAMKTALELKNAGAARLSQDQGIPMDAALAKATRLVDNHARGMDLAIKGDDFHASWNKSCAEIWAGYRKAGG